MPPPVMRAVEDCAVPCNRARSCSTGPPGATWIMKKLSAMIPIKVGMIEQQAAEEIGEHGA